MQENTKSRRVFIESHTEDESVREIYKPETAFRPTLLVLF
jgi:hypothetical protein